MAPDKGGSIQSKGLGSVVLAVAATARELQALLTTTLTPTPTAGESLPPRQQKENILHGMQEVLEDAVVVLRDTHQFVIAELKERL